MLGTAGARILTVIAARNAIVDYLRTHNSAVIVGETGSGKTTRARCGACDARYAHTFAFHSEVPQFLLRAGMADRGVIAVTQPRRVAAITLAQRVADEVGTPLGGRVGYAIRFDEVTSQHTRIKFMTDGMLLREFLSDADLPAYSIVIVDEAHERTVRTDILFGLLKDVQRRRPDLKVVVMSATIDADRFASYLGWYARADLVAHTSLTFSRTVMCFLCRAASTPSRSTTRSSRRATIWTPRS